VKKRNEINNRQEELTKKKTRKEQERQIDHGAKSYYKGKHSE
jgi:hypothetical protein